jgi:meso-butanediol dehydrogenase/(S,S)-butanediol dehydrogenase/diacetyl reductase
MAGKLENKVAIITAGGSGIGAATARRFTQEGASVVVADISGRRAEEVASAISASGGKAIHLKMDASDPEGVQASITLALDAYGRIDIMFNNAGMADAAPLDEISLESWNRVLAVTLTSTFLGLKYCLPLMRRQGGGAVINTASVSGTGGDYGLSSYNAAKAGVINLTRAAAIENAKFNIRVNCVCPGAINTRAAQILGGDRADEFRRLQAKAHPLGRMGEPEEIASAVTFLASAEASFITGAALMVDGGVTAGTGLPNMYQLQEEG